MNGPHGYLKDCLPSGKSESEVRQQRSSLNMLDVIRKATRTEAKCCPWCGAEPPLAAGPIAGRYLIACETEDCDTHKYGASLSEVWAIWNRRAP